MRNYECTIDLDRCISKISRRDPAAVEELYREFSGFVYKYALVILGDTGLAEDAMQNTFIRIMSSAGTYKLGTNPRAWIFRITRNVCMDIHNQKIPTSDVIEPETLSEEHLINDMSEAIAVREAVSKLTDREREVLSLYLFGGLKQTEIAKIIGLSYVRVRSIYECAIKKLRKEFCE